MIGPPEASFSSIFAQLPAALFCKLAMSHSAKEGRAEATGKKGDIVSHTMQKMEENRVEEAESEDRSERDIS